MLASEIAAYEYCARAYWLERVARVSVGDESDGRRAAGVGAHAAHGRRVALAHRLVTLAATLLVVLAVLIVVAIVR